MPPRVPARAAVLASLSGLCVALVILLAPIAGPHLPVDPLVPWVRAQVTTPFVPLGWTPIAPGVVHVWGSMSTTSGAQDVRVVTVDPRRPGVTIEAALSNDIVAGVERTSAMADRRSSEGHEVVAGINGDVWNGSLTPLANGPNGIHVEGGELMAADATQSRATFGFGPDRVARIGLVRETISMTTGDGEAFPVGHVNQEPDGVIALFTPRFGATLATALAGAEAVVGGIVSPLAPTGTWSGTVTTVRPAGSGAAIDAGTFVVVVPPDSPALATLITGARVSFTASISAGWEGATDAVSGRGYLVSDGAVSISPVPADASETLPRSAIGVTADGRVVMLTVDGGRRDSDAGADLDELASLLVGEGAVEAINLDGGGSSTLAIRQPGASDVSVVNTPPNGREIAVTNGIEVVVTEPTGSFGDHVAGLLRPLATVGWGFLLIPFAVVGLISVWVRRRRP